MNKLVPLSNKQGFPVAVGTSLFGMAVIALLLLLWPGGARIPGTANDPGVEQLPVLADGCWLGMVTPAGLLGLIRRRAALG